MADYPQHRLRQAHRRAAATLAKADFLHRHAAAELLGRLDYVRLEPECILDLGSGPGPGPGALGARYPGARLLRVDHAPEALASGAEGVRLCADARQLPLPDNSVDLVFCNLLLPYCRDPVPVLSEAARVLREPGLCLISTFGPQSLSEWREAWSAADGHSHTVPFPDMHDLGDLMVRAGLAEPVLDRDFLKISYADHRRLADDLRAAGSVNWTARRNRGLTSPRAAERFLRALDRQRDPDGRFEITVELICGQAWGQARPLRPQGPEAEVPLSELMPSRGPRRS